MLYNVHGVFARQVGLVQTQGGVVVVSIYIHTLRLSPSLFTKTSEKLLASRSVGLFMSSCLCILSPTAQATPEAHTHTHTTQTHTHTCMHTTMRQPEGLSAVEGGAEGRKGELVISQSIHPGGRRYWAGRVQRGGGGGCRGKGGSIVYQMREEKLMSIYIQLGMWETATIEKGIKSYKNVRIKSICIHACVMYILFSLCVRVCGLHNMWLAACLPGSYS